jgi:putative PIN family toxin of toxin-antitoxin system
MIRACVDANLLISYLLSPDADRAPNLVIRAGFNGQFTMVLSETTLQEAMRSVISKPWLAARITPERAGEFLERLRGAATIAPEESGQRPPLTRDPGDDYLLAHAILEHVDYLVSGDKDLLVLGEIAGVRIVSPAAFVAILDRSAE